jgi:HK97 family phage major capsid protein
MLPRSCFFLRATRPNHKDRNMTLQEKRDAAAKLRNEATAIQNAGEERSPKGLTPEEGVKFDSLIAQHDQIVTEITNEEAELRSKALESRKAAAAKSVTNIPAEQPYRSAAQDVEVMGYRCKTLHAFTGPDAQKRAYFTGRWIMGAFNPSDEANRRWVRDHGMEYRVATEGVNSSGGYLVPTQMEQAIIDLREKYGTFRQYARVIPMTSDSLTVPVSVSDQTAYFVGEKDAGTASDKVWNQVNLVAKTCVVESRYSSNLSEDSIINVADDLTMSAARVLAAKEDSCGWDGDGTSTYGGMIGLRTKIIDGNHTAGAVDVTTGTHNLFTEIDQTDIIGMMAKLPTYAAADARFFASNALYVGVMLRLAGALAGNNITTLQGNLNRAFLGYPVALDATLPAGIATDYDAKTILFYGDMRQAVIFGDRRGITLTVDPYSLSSYLQTKLVWSERFDIVAHSLGDNTTAGPLVALVGSSS